MEPCQQAVECDEAGFRGEDAIELCRESNLALVARRAAVSLEIAVELPDRGADGGLGGAILVGESVELMNQALGMNPAQAMLADPRLREGRLLNWPASSLTMTLSRSKPWALMLPHSAPSVAIGTGSALVVPVIENEWDF
jgi:hypothetical protein